MFYNNCFMLGTIKKGLISIGRSWGSAVVEIDLVTDMNVCAPPGISVVLLGS